MADFEWQRETLPNEEQESEQGSEQVTTAKPKPKPMLISAKQQAPKPKPQPPKPTVPKWVIYVGVGLVVAYILNQMRK